MSRKDSRIVLEERAQEDGRRLLWKPTTMDVGDDGGSVWDPEELTFSRRIAHLSILFPYSCLALLMRLCLSRLASYSLSAVPPLLWSQAVGCALYGVFLGRREDLRALYPPLYTGLAVGLAESMTSVSGWLLDAFLAFSNASRADRGGIQDAMDGIAQLLITLLVAHAAVSLGLYVASHLPVLPTPFLAASFRPTRTLDYLVTVVSISLYVLTLCAYLVLAPAIAANGWASNVVLPLVIAPAGCVVRYYLSRANPTRWVLGGKRNGGRVTWPIGTGAANLVGCLVLAATYILSRVDLGRAVLSGSACSAVIALQDGFGGTVTSLATFAVEARTEWKSQWQRWAYICGTVGAGMCVMVAAVGGPEWSGLDMGGVCRAR